MTAPARNGFAVAALVLGIVGSVVGLIPILAVPALICGILAVVFGIIAHGRAKVEGRRGMAIAGWLTGILAIALSIIGFVVVGNVFNDLNTHTSVRVSPPNVYTEPTPTTATPPITSPAATPSKVTLANYNKITNGMTLAQVTAILGPPTAKTADASASTGSISYSAVSYTWDGPSVGFTRPHILVGFINGTVAMKVSNDLS